MRMDSRVPGAALAAEPRDTPPTTPPPAPAAAGITHRSAITLLYTAAAGDYSPGGRITRDLLLLHQVLPGTGEPWRNCPSCFGGGRVLSGGRFQPGHCHCRCDVCACGDPVCGGPCHHLAVLLDALVFMGVPDAAADMPATLSRVRLAAVHRIVSNAAGRAPVTVTPGDGETWSVMITAGDAEAANIIADALYAQGYRCERRDRADISGAVAMTVTSIM